MANNNGDAAGGDPAAPSQTPGGGGGGQQGMSGVTLLSDPVDVIIDKLLSVRGARPGKQVDLSEAEVKMLCLRSRDLLISQPMLLELEAPIKICGDVHGQYYDLLRLFEYGGFPPEANYIFLGDYVDRGCFSCEVLALILALKIKFKNTVFLLRGNHECRQLTTFFNFRSECKAKMI